MLRKHGVGEVLPDSTQDLTKQAAHQQPWSEEDERELADESSRGDD